MGSFERGHCLFSRDRGEGVEELVERVAAFEIVDEVSQGHTCANEYWGSTQDLWIRMHDGVALSHRPS